MRFSGQGMMSHTATTTISRYFTKSRGKALSVGWFGLSSAEFILPVLIVFLLTMTNWQNIWLIISILVLIFLPIASYLLVKNINLDSRETSNDGEFKEEINIDTRKKINLIWGIDDYNKKIFFSKSLDHNSIESLVDDLIENNENFSNNIEVDLDKYNGDEIEIKFVTKRNGYIIFMDNWSPGWKVFVNDKEEKMLKTLDVYKTVKVDIGNNKIKFKYVPW